MLGPNSCANKGNSFSKGRLVLTSIEGQLMSSGRPKRKNLALGKDTSDLDLVYDANGLVGQTPAARRATSRMAEPY